MKGVNDDWLTVRYSGIVIQASVKSEKSPQGIVTRGFAAIYVSGHIAVLRILLEN
jgi:hypothetical protein